MSSRRKDRSNLKKGLTFVGGMVVMYGVYRWYSAKAAPELASSREEQKDEPDWERNLGTKDKERLAEIRKEVKLFAEEYRDKPATECVICALKRKYDSLKTDAIPEDVLISEVKRAILATWSFFSIPAFYALVQSCREREFVCSKHGATCKNSNN